MNLHFSLFWAWFLSANFISLTLWVPIASAQSTPPSGVTIPPGASDAVQESIPRPSEITPPPPTPSPAPSEPVLETSPSPPSQTTPNLDVRFPVQRIEVMGNTVLQDEITALVSQYQVRGELTFEELLELRSRITQLYLDNGYVTSGAFLPNNQRLRSGIIRIQVIEGTLERIDLCLLSSRAGKKNEDVQASASPSSQTGSRVSEDTAEIDRARQINSPAEAEQQAEQPLANQCGSGRLQESYIRSRLASANTTPVKQQRIEEALQLLQINPLIQQVNAQLTAGSAPGQNVLLVAVRERPPLHVEIGGDNYQSPSIGSQEFSVQGSYDNLLGLGDRISAGYGITEGLNSFNIGYAIPVNAQDGTLSLSYNNDNSLIIEDKFKNLDIRSESQTFSVGFRQPIIRTPETEVALGLQADLRRSTTFLEGEPFSFSLGSEDGKSNVTAIRFSQDWLYRDARTVLAARSQFSFGIDAFDATVNNTGTDGTFFAWLGQFQWVQRLSSRFVLVSRVNAQLTPDSLLSLERIGYGGVETLRGYRQNQLVTDNGILGAVETRFALLSNSNRLQLIPFVEAGYGWNNQSPDPNPATLASIGLGLRWLITPDLSVRVDYGIPLVDVKNEGNSLQDRGLYFSVRYAPF